MRKYSPPVIHCSPTKDLAPPPLACRDALDVMPFSRKLHIFGLLNRAGVDVILPKLYGDRGPSKPPPADGNLADIKQLASYLCVVGVDLSGARIESAEWVQLTQAAVAVDAMCVRRGLVGAAIALGGFSLSLAWLSHDRLRTDLRLQDGMATSSFRFQEVLLPGL